MATVDMALTVEFVCRVVIGLATLGTVQKFRWVAEMAAVEASSVVVLACAVVVRVATQKLVLEL